MRSTKRARTAESSTSDAKSSKSSKTPDESKREGESIGRDQLAEKEVLDDADDPSVTPVRPQCRKCGETFTTEAELVDHAKS